MQVFRGLEQWGRERALGALAWAMPTPEVHAQQAGESIRQQPSSRILLIGPFQRMGQFLCATPLIRALDAGWPGASLQFLGNPVNAAAARANPRLDRVWIWNKAAPWEWPGQLSALRKERFDLAILLTTERPSATAVILARAIGAEWVAGYVATELGRAAEHAAELCHIRIPLPPEKNEVEKFLGFARALGVPSQGLQLEWAPTPEEEQAAETLWSGLHLPANGPRAGLFIGGKAERTDRLWPVSHFAKLADDLKAAGIQVIALGPPPPAGVSSGSYFPDEHRRMEEFRRMLTWPCPVVQEASVGRVATLIRKLDLLVCPDGGILHLAAAVGTPTLGLFFSTDPEVWSHDRKQIVIDGRGQPSAKLSPETVAAEVTRFLGVGVSQ